MDRRTARDGGGGVRSSVSGFVDELCEWRDHFRWLFGLSVFLLLLNLPYLLVVEPDSALYVVTTLNAVGFGAFTVFSGLALWYCGRRV